MDDKCTESSCDNDTINQSDVNRFKTNEINDPSEKSDKMDSEKEIENETEANQSGGDAEKNEYRKNSGFSFTIDFSGGKTVDNRKLKEMAERFQSRQQRQQEQRRHRRGASLSKLNDISTESSKRHSWSPCSSQERFTNTSDQNFKHNETICAETELKSPNKFQPKSATLRNAMQNISLGATTAIEINERQQSEYSSTVKQTFDEQLITTPLEYIRSSDDEGSIGIVSEAGTYTVDGDNYTEEEKERMSIDAMGKKRFELAIDAHNFNDNLNTFQSNYGRVESTKATIKCSENRNSLKKVPMVKSPKTTVKFGQVCYIDKSKMQVKTLAAHPTKTKDRSESDRGMFTSITACGVLDMQSGRKPSPKLPSRKCRRNSLTKLQIDSSEYIQPKIIQNSSYTDNEKAQHNEYQLNIFSNTSSYTSLASTPQTDDEVLSVECIENMSNSIKTAQTKNDWIQEWAKNARRRNTLLSSSLSNTLPEQDSTTNVCSPRQIERIKQTRDRRMTQSYDISYSNHGGASQSSDIDYHDKKIVPSNISRPPISPTKIPSPRHTQHRVRSSSANRMLYNTDFHNFDVEKYIAKTTSSKQKHLARTNSPENLISPDVRHGSPPLNSSTLIFNYESPQIKTHKRNLSLDISNKVNTKSNPNEKTDKLPKRHTRHNSYEHKQIQLCELNSMNIDQTTSRTSNRMASHTPQKNPYEKRIYSSAATSTVATGISYKRLINRNGKPSMIASPKSNDRTSDYRQSDSSPCSSLYKSNESEVYHINANDDLRISNDDILSSPDTDDNPKNDKDKNPNDFVNQINSSDKILSNTRYNKAFRMRMEQNKQIISTNQGVSACPNTPEMTRRSSKARSSFRDTISMPRDSSLTRLKTELQNFQTTKKNLKQPTSKPTVTTTVSNNTIKQRVQPKYLDISKYKPVQGQNFLKRDESKSTLVNRSEMKKSPSAVGLSRNDTARSSIRVKSAGAKPSTPSSTRDSKSREQELLMWRRRATYDPMKAAAEGKKKQLEGTKKSIQKSGPLNSGNSAVLRSQSFHNGTMQFGDFQLRPQFSEDSLNRIHWAMTSTESSEEEEFGDDGQFEFKLN